MIGLKRGCVSLYDHEPEWKIEAANMIDRLKELLGDLAEDIQHVGSTAVTGIKAKPILDIAVSAPRFEKILERIPLLEEHGIFYCRNGPQTETQKLFACGSYYTHTGDLQTHFIHIVRSGSREWTDYIRFRDYLNAHPQAAGRYERLKIELAGRNRENRTAYTEGKKALVVRLLYEAQAWSWLGKTAAVQIDRPLGSCHPLYPERIYPVNYGFLPGTTGGDGEALDVYVLGTEEPLCSFTGRIIAVVYRENDWEDKLVAAPEGMRLCQEEIERTLHFQEQFFLTTMEMMK
ncbi:MAG: hypothetical protein HFJ80_06845 [Clostridiales bacterium]|nr:hypothetical protein [Clostridiales bacterium]